MTGARKALETKRAKATDQVVSLPDPRLPPAPRRDLEAMAMLFHDNVTVWQAEGPEPVEWASMDSGETFLATISVDYVLDRLREYQARVKRSLPLLDPDRAHVVITQKILTAIAKAYPWLQPECERRAAAIATARDTWA